MSTDVNKTLIGAFVCGAIVFLIASIILLSKDSFFENDVEFILFFRGSVSGLNVGAPVVFRGVPLGRVTNISLFSSEQNTEVTIPVTIKISGDHILQHTNTTKYEDNATSPENSLERMIKKGLRARLETSSFLTGQSRIELDFFPNTVAKYIIIDGGTPEIPTIDSTKDMFMRTIGDMPLDEIAKKLLSSLEGISKLVNSEKIYETIDSFNGTLLAGKTVFKKLDLISTDINNLIIKMNSSASTIDKEMPNLFKNVNSTMVDMSITLKQLKITLAQAGNVISPNSVTVHNFNDAIKEFEKASRSISELANMLERNPEALLMGKGDNR